MADEIVLFTGTSVVDVGTFIYFLVEIHTLVTSFLEESSVNIEKNRKSAYYNKVKLWPIQTFCLWHLLMLASF